MTLSPKIKEHIRRHSLDERPNECCGIIIEQDRMKRTWKKGDQTLPPMTLSKYLFAIRAKNVATLKDKNFEIDGQSYLKSSRMGKMVAYYHSHPGKNSEFSNLDKMTSQAHNLPLIMYFLKENKFSVYES